MTKFSEIKEPERSTLTALYLEVLKTRAQEDRDLNSLGVRLLFISNAAALAAVITFIGALVQTGKSYLPLVTPLKFFFAGGVCAAAFQVLLMAMSSMSTAHLGTQLEQFVKNQLELEALRGYGFTRRGLILFRLLYAASAASFFLGAWRAFTALGQL
jgi:hypothetical protein